MKPLILAIFIAMLNSCETNIQQQNTRVLSDFSLEDSDTHQRFYLNQHKGRIVLLVFRSTGCRYCVLEMNALSVFKDRMDENGVLVVSILIDPENRSSSVNGGALTKNHFPTLLDWRQMVSRQFKVNAVPTTVVIGKQGRETFRRFGYNSAIMDEILDHLALLADNNR